MKIITIMGARPQFIKAGSVSPELFRQELVDTDQFNPNLYGGGKASERIVTELLNG